MGIRNSLKGSILARGRCLAGQKRAAAAAAAATARTRHNTDCWQQYKTVSTPDADPPLTAGQGLAVDIGTPVRGSEC